MSVPHNNEEYNSGNSFIINKKESKCNGLPEICFGSTIQRLLWPYIDKNHHIVPHEMYKTIDDGDNIIVIKRGNNSI